MSKWVVRLVAMVMVAAIAFSAVGFVAAQGPDGPAPGRDNGPFVDGRFGPGERVIVRLLTTSADAAGMTVPELIAAVREADGQTVSDILTANGVDPQAVSDAVKAEATEIINNAAAEGTITDTQAGNALNELDNLLDSAMNSDLPLWANPLRDAVRDRAGDAVENTLLGVLSDMAGVDVQDVVRDALTPPTLAEIAESYGLDTDTIIAETETRITDEVNQKITNGTISAEQGETILDGLHDRLMERFNSPLGLGVIGDRLGDRFDNWGQRGRFNFGA